VSLIVIPGCLFVCQHQLPAAPADGAAATQCHNGGCALSWMLRHSRVVHTGCENSVCDAIGRKRIICSIT